MDTQTPKAAKQLVSEVLAFLQENEYIDDDTAEIIAESGDQELLEDIAYYRLSVCSVVAARKKAQRQVDLARQEVTTLLKMKKT